MSWLDLITKIFDSSFATKWDGSCTGWTKELVIVHVISDFLIWFAYMTIPVLLIKIAKSRKDMPFNIFFFYFAAFIIGCGFTHLMGVVTPFFPYYYLDFWIKAFTALASIWTAWLLWKNYPFIVSLPNPFVVLEELRVFYKLVDGLRDYAFIMLDKNGIIKTWNDGAERIEGYKSEEIIGRHFSCLYPEEDIARGWPNEEIDKAYKLGEIEDEGWRVRKDGSKFWANVIMTKVVDDNGNMLGFSKITRDLTERRAIQAELERSNKELEQFAYIASHDLQEPLRMVASYCGLIERRYKDKLDNDGVEFIHFAVDGAHRMQALISDLLKYSRVGKMKELSPIEIDKCIQYSIANLHESIKDCQAEVIVEVGKNIIVIGDDVQLTLLFQNLISNGIKFRKEGEKPVVRVSYTEKINEYEFCVSDNGIGIDMKYKDRLFVIFQRLHADRDKYPGTGVGLAICHKIINKHGGKIWVESEIGKGSKFFFTLKKCLK